jgi:hypothetical protein
MSQLLEDLRSFRIVFSLRDSTLREQSIELIHPHDGI